MIQMTDLNRQYIGGEWRDGQSESVLADLNPLPIKRLPLFGKRRGRMSMRRTKLRLGRKRNGITSIPMKKSDFRKSRGLY